MAFEPENALEEALARAKTDVLARPRFFQLLMTEPLIVVGELVAESENAAGGMNLALVRHNGRDFHPIFTSFGRMRAIAAENTRHFAAVGRDLFARTKGADFVLNPNSETGKLLLANEIAFWLDPSARARRTLARNPPRAIFGTLREPPRILMEALVVLFRNRHDVVTARMLEIAFTDRNEPPHPLIAIETVGSWEKIAAEVSELAVAVAPDVILDLIRADPAHPDASLAPHLGHADLIYQRQSSE